MVTSVEFAHLFNATQHMGWVVGWGGGNIRCICTLETQHTGWWVGWGVVTSVALPHLVDAMVGGVVGVIPSVALAHLVGATLLWRFNNRNWWKQLGRLCKQQ